MGSERPKPEHVESLRALAVACEGAPGEGATTARVDHELARRRRRGGAATRTLLRALRRAGYVQSLPGDPGEPVRWTPSPRGWACL